jgi:aldose 1-epimerase
VPGVDPGGALLHGFAKDRPWRVVLAEATLDYAELRAILSSFDQPDTLQGYPFPYELAVSCRLDESGLTHAVHVCNRGETPMPFGYGAHPYFRIPLDPTGRRQDCRLTIPASHRWDLARIASLAEGDRLSWQEVARPVESGFDPRWPVRLENRLLDDALTGLNARNGWIECRVDDPAAGLTAVMRCTNNFPTIVVYTPPNRPGLCFEPWTCPPNAINLAAQGVENTGLIVLPPGEIWQAAMVLTLAAIE